MDKQPAPDTPMLDLTDVPPGLTPQPAVLEQLVAGRTVQQRGETPQAAQIYRAAVETAQGLEDCPGEARALAQLAALEELCGELDAALVHNNQAAERFLFIGDGAGLVQTSRLHGFLRLRQGQIEAAATEFARALALALQLDTRLVMMTLNQIVPVIRHLIDANQLPALLALGAALAQAVDHAQQGWGEWPAEMADVAELARTVAGIFPPLAIMADEADLPAEQRRSLAARATHQAWMVDALTRRRWHLADLVEETLQAKLDFHEKLD